MSRYLSTQKCRLMYVPIIIQKTILISIWECEGMWGLEGVHTEVTEM